MFQTGVGQPGHSPSRRKSTFNAPLVWQLHARTQHLIHSPRLPCKAGLSIHHPASPHLSLVPPAGPRPLPPSNPPPLLQFLSNPRRVADGDVTSAPSPVGWRPRWASRPIPFSRQPRPPAPDWLRLPIRRSARPGVLCVTRPVVPPPSPPALALPASPLRRGPSLRVGRARLGSKKGPCPDWPAAESPTPTPQVPLQRRRAESAQR